MAEILPYFLYVVVPIPLPITPTQILAVDLGFELLMTLSFAWEPAEDEHILLSIPPRRQVTLQSSRAAHERLKNTASSSQFNLASSRVNLSSGVGAGRGGGGGPSDLIKLSKLSPNGRRAYEESTELLNASSNDNIQKDFQNLNNRLHSRYANYLNEAKELADKKFWANYIKEWRDMAWNTTGERLVDGEVLIWSYIEAGLMEVAACLCTYFAIFWFQFGVSGEIIQQSQKAGLYWKPHSPDLRINENSVLVCCV